jgi:hypothetical protein
MSRVNSGDDRTTMVCDGTELFYSGDAHSYYEYGATQQCNLRLIDFYEPSLKQLSEPSNSLASVSIIGEDHVLLADGESLCGYSRRVEARAFTHSKDNVYRSGSTGDSEGHF